MVGRNCRFYSGALNRVRPIVTETRLMSPPEHAMPTTNLPVETSAKKRSGAAARSYPERRSAAFPRCGREFGFGAIRRGLLVDDLRHLEQQIAVSIGGDRVGEPVIYPIECVMP